jgi:hypothetical protein
MHLLEAIERKGAPQPASADTADEGEPVGTAD